MTNYQFWQIEKYGSYLPEPEDKEEVEEPDFQQLAEVEDYAEFFDTDNQE